jgi:epoxide hydrolase-like predicted phosphatase
MDLMPDIRAVIFDYGRVICDFDIRIFLRGIAQYSSRSPEQLIAGLDASGPIERRYETGLLTSHQFYEEISRLADLHMPENEFIRAYTEIFSPIPETFELIHKLKGTYKLGLLSNTSEWHFQYGIRTVEVFPLFDAVTLSFQVGAMKPDPRIYRDMVSKLAIPPEACIYIDDVTENVEGGRAFGFSAIHYTNHDALSGALRSLGVGI